MNTDRIKNLIAENIEHSNLSLDKESLKFDFKYEWYKLNTLKGINEFLKDTTAMANTYGLDGFIVIGYDEKRKLFKDAKFEQCGLKDNNEINKIILKRVSHMFEINTYDLMIQNNPMSIIHIPPAWEKPFFIRNYQTFNKQDKIKKEYHHKVFVRKNTGTYSATKHDFDLMFYDRKNIEPDYRIFSNIYKAEINNEAQILKLKFTVENAGKRPLAFVDYKILLLKNNGDEIELPASQILSDKGNYKPENYSEILLPYHIKNFNIEFTTANQDTNLLNEIISTSPHKIKLLLMLSNKKIFLQNFKNY